jgi:predicted MFS family arabinose efflux permease
MEKTRYYPLILLITLFVSYIVEGFLRMAANALTPILIEELQLSYSAMGFLISTLSMVYGLMQIPSGVLVERLGSKRAIIYFTVLTIIGLFLFWSSVSYNYLLVAQILIGLGCSTFYISAVKLISAWFPSNRKATAVGILSASLGLANFASYIGFPRVIETLGSWRPMYLGVGFILIVSWVSNIFILKDGEDSTNGANNDSPPLKQVLVETVKDRRLYPFIAGYLLSTVAWVFMTWMPQFMIEVKGFTYVEVGQIASLGSIAGIPGSIIISAISDRLKRRKLPLVVTSGLAAVLVFIFMGAPASTPLIVFMVLNFFIGFTFSFWVLLFSMVPETLPPRSASIGLGLVNGMGTIGFSVFAPLYGYFVDITGKYTISNQIIQLLILLMPIIFYLFIKECYGGIQEDTAQA